MRGRACRRQSLTFGRPAIPYLRHTNRVPAAVRALARAGILPPPLTEHARSGHTPGSALILRPLLLRCRPHVSYARNLPREREYYRRYKAQIATNAISHAMAPAVSIPATTSSRTCHLSLICRPCGFQIRQHVLSTTAIPGPPEHRLAASCACSKRSLSSLSVMTPLSMSTLTSTAMMP